mmetsp:Transcript_23985/g.61058  ORF Transcript_23985/g.61058 Transcript_23985/m.61058 type:complete len:212 (-) Transcript_23985:64-699(-)
MLLTFEARSNEKCRLRRRAPSLVVVGAVVGRRLDLVDPVPLSAGDLHRHGAGDDLLRGVDRGEQRDDQTEDEHRRDVEKQVLGLHEELVIAPDQQPGAVPVRNVVLRDVLPQLAVGLRGVARHDEGLTPLLHEVELRLVVDRVRIVVVLGVLGLGPGAIGVEVRPGVAVAAEEAGGRCCRRRRQNACGPAQGQPAGGSQQPASEHRAWRTG